jgi:hypothetical protein
MDGLHGHMDRCGIAEGKKVSRDVNNMVAWMGCMVTWTGVVLPKVRRCPRDVNNMVT